MIDSHCHLDRLDLSAYQGSLAKLIEAAGDAGVTQMICIAINSENINDVIHIAEQFPNVHATVGIHPSDEVGSSGDAQYLLNKAAHPKVVAIGETGLDYHYNQGDLSWQRERFALHIDVAKQLKKPLVIHTRDARKDTIDIMKAHAAQDVSGVMHCFTEDWDMAKQALDLGFYISISGIITFKNADALREVVKKIPLSQLLIETDAPYLAPVPFRGKKNEPKYLPYVAQTIAAIKDITVDALTNICDQNTKKLFRC